MAGGFLVRQSSEEAALRAGDLHRAFHSLPDLSINDEYWIAIETTTKEIFIREFEIVSDAEALLISFYAASQVTVTPPEGQGILLQSYPMNTATEIKTTTMNVYTGSNVTVNADETPRDLFLSPIGEHLAVVSTGRIAGKNQQWFINISNTADKAQDSTGAIVRMRWEDM